MFDRRPGCLGGLFQMLMLDVIFDWLQRRIGFGRGGCGGCGCGIILVILFIFFFLSILFGTNWGHAFMPMIQWI